jgi:hypothetical protein
VAGCAFFFGLHLEVDPMPVKPKRKGIVKTYSFDPDAVPLLKAMTPNSRGVGLLLSELIRKEARERQQRPALIATLERQSRAMLEAEVARAIGD